ncbi:MAG TPA: thiamine pyrophosphate-binding protein, partial [Kiloniellales bacterium]|nr:thiamine pyrophosphate-binding protein [Kiloniellales bacterium]
ALRSRPDAVDLERAAELLAGARKPLILAGGGVLISRAAETLQAFAEAAGIPVAHTMSGKGAIACTSPLNAGLFGRYDRIANALIEESDCLLVVGCKLGEIATKRYTVPSPGKTLIHLEVWAEEIGRTYQPTVPLWGDAKAGLEALGELLGERGRSERTEWLAQVSEQMTSWREKVRERLESEEVPVSMGRLMGELNQVLPADALLVADGGFAAHWGGLLYDSKQAGRGFVPDRGFASIGYGLPGAMGCKLAAPERAVVALTGDGGFNMVLGELETARRLGLAVTIIVVNNAASGYVKALQHLMYGEGAYQSSDLAETNYAKVAEALGCKGIRVEAPGELRGALERALAEKGRPTILDVVVTRDPAKMLPGVDNRAAKIRKGDRVA